jgi:hypothetical protein
LVTGLLGAFVVGLLLSSLIHSPSARPWPEGLLVVFVALFMGFLTWVGWFTTRPPILTVTPTELTLIGGPYRRRVDRSDVIGVYRGLDQSTSADAVVTREKAYFVVVDGIRAVRIPIRNYVPSGLDNAMARLGVPIKGDFKRVVSEFKIRDLFDDPGG